jgi:hypothetical protein
VGLDACWRIAEEFTHVMKIKGVPVHWAMETDLLTEAERRTIALLRIAGCECELPLLGHTMRGKESVGPRCRLCNTQVILEP